MPLARSTRVFAATVVDHVDEVVLVRGWVHRLRTLASTVFVVVRDCSGAVQGVCGAASFPGPHIKLDDTVEVRGRVRQDVRAKWIWRWDTSMARRTSSSWNGNCSVGSSSS